MPLETYSYDTAEHLKSPKAVAAYIEAVLENGDPAVVANAIGVIARARGMAEIARKTGRARESLYRALSNKGNPQLDTLMAVRKAMGLQLSVQPTKAHTKRNRAKAD